MRRSTTSSTPGSAALRFEEVVGEKEGAIQADRVVLATGFHSRRPGGRWLDTAIQQLQLPCAPCGFPLIDQTLRWAQGIFVTGPLAELEIGPVARNIIGARLASERLLRAA